MDNTRLTTSQAAAILCVQEQSVRIAIRRGTIAATYDQVARRYWIAKDEVERYLVSHSPTQRGSARSGKVSFVKDGR